MDKSVSVKLRLGIVLLPIVFSWFTLKKGYSTLSRVISFAWLLFTMAVSASGDKQASTLVGITILGFVVYSIGELFILLYKKANQRKQKMLSIVNDDEQLSKYGIEKKLTPSAQKFVSKTYGIEKTPVELSTSEPAVQVSITTSTDHEDDWKSYDSIEAWERDCTPLWTGTTKDIEFSYASSWSKPKERRTLTPHEFGIDGNGRGYVKGICHKSNEQRTFKLDNFETKIKVCSQRFDQNEWIEKYLDLDLYELHDRYGVNI
ncbi:TPA: WYL domain-containing protein [Vibrio antiquarius]